MRTPVPEWVRGLPVGDDRPTALITASFDFPDDEDEDGKLFITDFHWVGSGEVVLIGLETLEMSSDISREGTTLRIGPYTLEAVEYCPRVEGVLCRRISEEL
jgi:hypothetical protein